MFYTGIFLVRYSTVAVTRNAFTLRVLNYSLLEATPHVSPRLVIGFHLQPQVTFFAPTMQLFLNGLQRRGRSVKLDYGAGWGKIPRLTGAMQSSNPRVDHIASKPRCLQFLSSSQRDFNTSYRLIMPGDVGLFLDLDRTAFKRRP